MPRSTKNEEPRTAKNNLFARQINNATALLAVDCLILLAGLFFGNLIIYFIHGVPVSMKYSLLLLPVWCAGACVTGQVPGWGLGAVEELRRLQLLLISVFALAGIATFLRREQIVPSRIVYLTSYMVAAVFLPFGRVMVRKVLSMLKVWGCACAVYGDRETLNQILDVLGRQASIGFYPTALFSDQLADEQVFRGLPIHGRIRDVEPDIPVAVASIAHLKQKDLTGFVDHTLAAYHKVVLFPDLSEGILAWITPRNFGGMIGLEVAANLLHPFSRLLKRSYETTFVLLLMPLWLPLMLVLAAWVFLKDGKNPFYTQKRSGRNGRAFNAIKLRSMGVDAEEVLQHLLESDPVARSEWESSHKLKKDPRVTWIGRFLRRFSLDELPQFIHVLLGQMALVGPRPLPDYHLSALSEQAQMLRSRVRPGLTGLWQVSGRSDCTREEMDQWDSFYVRNWSVWMDLYVVSRTVRAVVLQRGAY